jgi:hypothetical protein
MPAATGRLRSASVKTPAASAGLRRTHDIRPGIGDKVEKVFSLGKSRCRSSTTRLSRKLPKDTPRSPSWVALME